MTCRVLQCAVFGVLSSHLVPHVSLALISREKLLELSHFDFYSRFYGSIFWILIALVGIILKDPAGGEVGQRGRVIKKLRKIQGDSPTAKREVGWELCGIRLTYYKPLEIISYCI